MTPTYDKIHNAFKLNGYHYEKEELLDAAYSYVKEGDEYEQQIGDFLLDWLDSKDYLNLKTSGSTGPKKMIKVKKQAMVNSAIATGDYFELSPKDSALLCLPAGYIAGKMMIIRAMILGLELEAIEPEALLMYDYEKHYDFCAMVPLQLRKSLDRIQNIDKIIVGGASIPADLLERLQELPAKVYETYGMTETVSHIAVKVVNTDHKTQYFQTLPGIAISQDDRGCLVIDAPDLREETIVTNDMVKLHSDSEFELIGRYDNMINSGGINLFPEKIESKLQKSITKRFFITSENDQDLGERVVLVMEGKSNDLDSSVFEQLEKFEVPRKIYSTPRFVETKTKKIQRAETFKLAKEGVH